MNYSIGRFGTRGSAIAIALVLGSTTLAFAGHHKGSDETSVSAYSSVNAQLEAMDDNRDAEITRAEAKDYYDKLYRKLARTDDKPGISVEDLVKGPQKLASKKNEKHARDRRNRLRDHFDDLDYNRDDMIDRGEFLDGTHPRHDNKDISADKRDTKLLNHFEEMDSNGDGYLSKDEFLHNHHHDKAKRDGDDDRMYDRAKRALHKADKNGDGSLSRLEFVDAQWARFNRADSNKDDKLNRDEIRWSIRASGNAGAHNHQHHNYSAPTDLRGRSDFEADLDAEVSTWRNPDER